MKIFLRFLCGLSLCVIICGASAAGREPLREIGVAKIDITPDYPVRLSGYGNRRKESEGVTQHIFAKALAIGSDKEGPAILITVDNCGVPASVRDEVVRRLNQKKGIKPERVAVGSSHSHSAPCTSQFPLVLSFVKICDCPRRQCLRQRLVRITREQRHLVQERGKVRIGPQISRDFVRLGFLDSKLPRSQRRIVGLEPRAHIVPRQCFLCVCQCRCTSYKQTDGADISDKSLHPSTLTS